MVTSIKYPNTLLYETLSFGIPVLSFSLASISARRLVPPPTISVSSSISALKPFLIIPPSRKLNGGSSTIALSIKLLTSSSKSTFSYTDLSIAEETPDSLSLIIGKCSIVEERDLSSFAFAVEYAILERSLSISFIPESASLISSLKYSLSKSSATAFCLFVISVMLISGFSSHERSILFPIAVFVLSITQRSECFLSPLIIDFVSSRFLLALKSSAIKSSLS